MSKLTQQEIADMANAYNGLKAIMEIIPNEERQQILALVEVDKDEAFLTAMSTINACVTYFKTYEPSDMTTESALAMYDILHKMVNVMTFVIGGTGVFKEEDKEYQLLSMLGMIDTDKE